MDRAIHSFVRYTSNRAFGTYVLLTNWTARGVLSFIVPYNKEKYIMERNSPRPQNSFEGVASLNRNEKKQERRATARPQMANWRRHSELRN